jgi:hypothetical protein
MASRKEEKERLRQARLEAEKREAGSQRQRLLIGYGIAGVLAIAVLVGVFIVATSGGGGTASGAAHIAQSSGSTNGVPPDDRTGTPPPTLKNVDLKTAAKQAGCVLRLGLPDEGHDHVPPGTKINYHTSPPTSGDHVLPPNQQADGAYSETPDSIDYVHSMEHGRLLIEYAPSLPPKDQLALKGLYDTQYAAALLFPNADMPYEVAATTWTNMLGCKRYQGTATMTAIRAFGRQTWGKFGGEDPRAFPFTGPTPANPSS